MPVVYLGLGSNLGDREGYLKRAIAELKKCGIEVVKMSTIIETEPVGGPPQGKFLNAVAECSTEVPPVKLLKILKDIERSLGRVKTVEDGPRVIDIDILLYNKRSMKSPELTIPHPRMRERAFVMGPLKEIAPHIVKELN